MLTKENFGGMSIVDMIIAAGFTKSKSEARRLIAQRAIRIEDEVVTDPTMRVAVTKNDDGTFTMFTIRNKE